MPTPEEEALALYNKSLDTIIEQGREDYGPESFDSMSADVAEAVGPNAVLPLMINVMQTDAPQRVIEHLSANPDRAKKLAGMSPARQAAELGRIEAQLMPNGIGGAGAEPAWVSRAKGGEKRGLGDDVSDEVWARNFRKKYPDGFNPHRR